MPADVSAPEYVRAWDWSLCNLDLPVVERVDSPRGEWHVVRDDLLEGGTKTRYINALVNSMANDPEHDEVVFAGPAQGALPLALAVLYRERTTLFYPQRKKLTARQRETLEYGAQHVYCERPYVRPSAVKLRARRYSEERGALCIRWSLSYPEVVEAIGIVCARVVAEYGPFDEVWVAGGGGTLTRGIVKGVENASLVHCVGVGRNMLAHEVAGAIRHVEPFMSMDKAVEPRFMPPFPCDRFYDSKAWFVAQWGCACHNRQATRTGRKLFWNVVRDVREDLL